MAEPGYDALAEIEQEFKTFTDAMRYKLKVNAKKGKWENLTIEQAIAFLEGELQELKDAIAHKNVVEIMLEGADVANFALILANIAMTRFLADPASVSASKT